MRRWLRSDPLETREFRPDSAISHPRIAASGLQPYAALQVNVGQTDVTLRANIRGSKELADLPQVGCWRRAVYSIAVRRSQYSSGEQGAHPSRIDRP